MQEDYLFDYENLKFIWDPEKNEANIKKHGISFEKAVEVFGDTQAVIQPDIEHSFGEERFYIIGYIKEFEFLTVFYCEGFGRLCRLCRQTGNTPRTRHEILQAREQNLRLPKA